ncbi:MAG: DoxX family membrane protein [Bacilli bacterium]
MVAWLRNHVVARFIMTVLRIWLGWQWVSAAAEKMGSPVWTGSKAGVAITGFLQHAVSLSQGPHADVQGWYASFINAVALPNAASFSYLVSWGEMLVGLALILGVFTTFAALMGAMMNTAYLLAGTSSSNPNMLIIEALVMVAGFNAAVYGLDYWVIPWFRRIMKYEVDSPSGSGFRSKSGA